MRTLQEKERKNSFDYYLIKRNDRAAIYKQVDEDESIVAYEVFKIKLRKEGQIAGKIIEGGEVFPGNSDFGASAWAIPTFVGETKNKKIIENKLNIALKKAEKIFDEISLEEVQIDNNDLNDEE